MLAVSLEDEARHETEYEVSGEEAQYDGSDDLDRTGCSVVVSFRVAKTRLHCPCFYRQIHGGPRLWGPRGMSGDVAGTTKPSGIEYPS